MSSTDAARYARLKSEFLRLRELPTARRAAEIDALDDRSLAAELSALLDRDAQADTEVADATVESRMPAQLGGYRIVREVSRGGMGVVYLAERADGAYRQRVAIKLAGHVAANAEMALRFRLERQILATLEHPNIARLLDGGESADGVPYLVMEYVDGERIDEWCDARGATMRDRIAAILPVCAAVAYAHRNLVVHRDLKPANILMTADGAPKLLDFGIAKLLGSDAEFGTLTGEAGSLMTPRYASPEQLSGAVVGTQSDVYSLGVVLYELLSGQSPYGAAATSPARLIKAIVENEPLPVSRAVEARRGRPLRGDLDAVLAMALRKRPSERYASVDHFAADLQAWLDGRPVSARRGEWLYRAQRYARRHWFGLATAAVVLLLGIAFVVSRTLELQRTAIERDKARALSGFLLDLFQVADPSEARGNSVTVREILDRGARQLPAERSLPPAVRGQMLSTLGQVYRRLGLFDAAAPLLQAGETERRAAGPAEHAEAVFALAELEADRGHYGAAVDLASRALAETPADVGTAALRARMLHALGVAHLRQQDFAGARARLDDALALAPPDSREKADALASSANLYRERGDATGAMRDFAAAFAILERRGIDPWTRAKLANNLAVIDFDRGDLASAARHLERARELLLQVLGDRHPMIAMVDTNVAALDNRRGRYAAADASYARSLALREQLLDARNPMLADSVANLAYNRVQLGDIASAATLFDRALPALHGLRGPTHANTLIARRNHAALSLLQGELGESARTLRGVRDAAVATLGPAHEISQLAIARLALVEWLDGADPDAVLSPIDAMIAGARPTVASALTLAEIRTYAAALRLASSADTPRACSDWFAAEAAFARALEPDAWERVLADAIGEPCANGSADVVDHAASAKRLLLVRYGAAHPLVIRVGRHTP